MADIVAFAGPCLAGLDQLARAALLEGIDVKPPARRGDLLAACGGGAQTLVLLDGYFFTELSVPHKEMLYVLEEGLTVIGAASMGALRAAEMQRFGMVGSGTIFRWYADGIIDGDDEVAVLHLPAEYGYHVTTVALVEIRHALRSLLDQGICELSQAGPLLAAIKVMPFMDRSWDAVRREAAGHLGEAGGKALVARLESFSLKRTDAEAALSMARASVRADPPRRSGRSIFMTYWCEDSMRPPETASRSLPTSPSFMAGWNMAQLFHEDAPAFIAEQRLRLMAASAAERAGLADTGGLRERIGWDLQRRSERMYGGRLLPQREIDTEAEVQALADLAGVHFGSQQRAAAWLSIEYGLDGADSLVALLARQYGLFTSWALTRTFVLTSDALAPALELARAAEEVLTHFVVWSRGAHIRSEELMAVAARIWDCTPERVAEEGAARGLLEAYGFSIGLREILQRVAPAEQLPSPINDYQEAKIALRSAHLMPVRESAPPFGPRGTGRIPLHPARERFRILPGRS